MITVETIDAGVRVTIPKDELPPQRLNSFLDWLRLEAVAGKSRLPESEADRLAEQAKADCATKEFMRPFSEKMG